MSTSSIFPSVLKNPPLISKSNTDPSDPSLHPHSLHLSARHHHLWPVLLQQSPSCSSCLPTSPASYHSTPHSPCSSLSDYLQLPARAGLPLAPGACASSPGSESRLHFLRELPSSPERARCPAPCATAACAVAFDALLQPPLSLLLSFSSIPALSTLPGAQKAISEYLLSKLDSVTWGYTLDILNCKSK